METFFAPLYVCSLHDMKTKQLKKSNMHSRDLMVANTIAPEKKYNRKNDADFYAPKSNIAIQHSIGGVSTVRALSIRTTLVGIPSFQV